MKTYIFRTTTTMKEYNSKQGGVTVALIVILLFPFMVLAEILKNSK